MSRRNRIFLGILALFALGAGVMLYQVAADLDPRYRESAEETLVDTAHLLAALIETDINYEFVDSSRMRDMFQRVYSQKFEAKIYGITKREVNLRAYVTDINGTVLFDSTGKAEGEDFRAWHDVNLALAGKYGARTTRDDPDKPETAVMYVAVPIRDAHGIVGVVSVGKPVASQQELVATARQKLLSVGLITLAAFISLLVVVSVWLARPFGLIGDLLQILRQEDIRHPGRLLRRMSNVVMAAFHDMRDALAGRSYTEGYVQALTHEIKSPLTAIRGAAELLKEPMPEIQRQRFADNINEQVQRLQDLADRLLDLANLEKRRTLDDLRPIALHTLTAEVVEALQPTAQRRQVTVNMNVPHDLQVEGDPFLLHCALTNLLANAIDFSPPGTSIKISAEVSANALELRVRDYGPGVPDYALDRVFEKFYSLQRPDSGRKSTGLGLAFVREIAHLHGGKAYIGNHAKGGAVATLSLPAFSQKV